MAHKRTKKRTLEIAVASIQQQHGTQALHRGTVSRPRTPPHVSTGFPQLDATSGCGGIPLGVVTLIGGHTTSGKLTLAYKVLSQAQRSGHAVALLDLSLSSDPDYLVRCGINLDRLLITRPPLGRKAVHVLLDLARSKELRVLLVDSLSDLLGNKESARELEASTRRLNHFLNQSGMGVIFLDDPRPPWLRRRLLGNGRSAVRHLSALHIELEHEEWLRRKGSLHGYRSRARLVKSRWARAGQTVPLEIRFNGTVKARETW